MFKEKYKMFLKEIVIVDYCEWSRQSNVFSMRNPSGLREMIKNTERHSIESYFFSGTVQRKSNDKNVLRADIPMASNN
jgi:hypothetical protein